LASQEREIGIGKQAGASSSTWHTELDES
jgi:hypothetical protein